LQETLGACKRLQLLAGKMPVLQTLIGGTQSLHRLALAARAAFNTWSETRQLTLEHVVGKPSEEAAASLSIIFALGCACKELVYGGRARILLDPTL